MCTKNQLDEIIRKKLQLEMDSTREFSEQTGGCLICEMLKTEQDFGKRVIFENEAFSVVLPFFSEYPYGVYIISKNHKQNLLQMTELEKNQVAVHIYAKMSNVWLSAEKPRH